MTDSAAMHENYLEALNMVKVAEESPNMTVKYLPQFSRVYPQQDV